MAMSLATRSVKTAPSKTGQAEGRERRRGVPVRCAGKVRSSTTEVVSVATVLKQYHHVDKPGDGTEGMEVANLLGESLKENLQRRGNNQMRC